MEAFALLIPPALCAKDCSGKEKLKRFGDEGKLFCGKRKIK